jgi:methylated-DNA-[protein]-cysteine S-methyltransferase
MTSTTQEKWFESPVGLIRLLASEGVLTGLYWPNRSPTTPVEARRVPVLEETARQLDEYFRGRRTDFDLPMRMDGTPFQRAVWALLPQIPFGETCTYGDIAARLGAPNAVRAVGAANGSNPISIIVPCHRVIGAGGKLTGYGGGLPAKRWLLAHEAGRSGLFGHAPAPVSAIR